MVFTETYQTTAKSCVDALLDEIYRLRIHLNEMSRDVASLSNPRLVEISQMLDKKLNDYEQLKMRKTS